MANDTQGQQDLIILNGIDGTTGDYLIAPLAQKDAAKLAAKQPPDPNTAKTLGKIVKQRAEAHLGAAFDLDLEDLTQAGWAIVFHQDEEKAVKDALAPLVKHRQKQIGKDEIVKICEYRDNESVVQWLARHKIAFGPVEPEKMPYYILIIGSPVKIPLSFGHLLDAVYGVGRLHFDNVDGYKKYVESVIQYETQAKAPTSKEVVFFGPRNKNDFATGLSSEKLVAPLALGQPGKKSLIERASKMAKVEYKARLIKPLDSTKENLLDVLRPGAKGKTPSLLFTASHGLGWPSGHANQKGDQGALLCQNFPGRGLGPPKPAHYLAAADLPADARVHGMVSFHFACFSAGTPDRDRFSYQPGIPPPVLAPQPFFSPLPQALLSHPNGAALAVIGHVERAWQNSIVAGDAGPQIQAFENAIGFILVGTPLGFALKEFNDRFAVQSANLTDIINKVNLGKVVPDRELAALWLERNDAEGYQLLGDPAVRLRKDALQ